MNDPEAKSEWVRAALERHGGALTRYAASITGDPDTARDVVQETFVRLCDEPPARLNGCLSEWLFTVCRNRALDVRRKQQRMMPLADIELAAEPDADPSPASVAEQTDTSALALRLLRTLPLNQQEVIRLKFQAGLSYEEISRVTTLSVSNVGFLLHTALKTLRARMMKALWGPGDETE